MIYLFKCLFLGCYYVTKNINYKNYSTNSLSLKFFGNASNNDLLLDPNWITGFCDAEGYFNIIISAQSVDKWRVRASFEINLHTKDIDILYKIQKYFKGIGNIYVRKNRFLCVYMVNKINELNEIIILHFNKYPLISNKYCDFYLWSKVIIKILQKEHLDKTGFATILSLYASINRGLSSNILRLFPNIIVENKVSSSLPLYLNPYWVSGFVAGDGSFVLGVRKNKEGNRRFGLYWNFNVTQHSKDLELMKLLKSFFNCGYTAVRFYEKTLRCDFGVQDLNSIITKIIPHFKNYTLQNIKQLDFLGFKIVLDLVSSPVASPRGMIQPRAPREPGVVSNKKHLVKENQILIQNIINNMNLRRK